MKKNNASHGVQQPNDLSPTATNSNFPPEMATLLEQVGQLLEQNQPDQALQQLARLKGTSPWVTNAIGVCQLRRGNASVALNLFRSLVVGPGGIQLRSDVPVVFKTNFATCLIMAHQIEGAMNALSEVRGVDHPAVARLNSTMEAWKKNFSLWQKLNWYLGGYPSSPVQLDFLPGDLY